jgi:hypothetical protein
MKLWKRILVLNTAGLLGVASSLFVLPANTPLYLWLVLSALVLVALNVAILVRHRKTATGTRPKTSKTWDVIIALCLAFWALEVLVHILRR